MHNRVNSHITRRNGFQNVALIRSDFEPRELGFGTHTHQYGNVNSNETAALSLSQVKAHTAAVIAAAIVFYSISLGMSGTALASYAVNGLTLHSLSTVMALLVAGSGSILSLLTFIRICRTIRRRLLSTITSHRGTFDSTTKGQTKRSDPYVVSSRAQLAGSSSASKSPQRQSDISESKATSADPPTPNASGGSYATSNVPA